MTFLHGFQQRCLGLGGGTVDLIGQQQVGEYRPLAQFELFGLQVVNGVAGDIAGHQVRGELDTGEITAKAAGQGSYQQGLAQAWHAFQQYVAACDQGGEHVVNHKVLANHGLAQFHAQRLRLLAGMLKVFGGQGGGQSRVAHDFWCPANG